MALALVLAFFGACTWCALTLFDDGDDVELRVNLADHTSRLCPTLMSRVTDAWYQGGKTQDANDWAMRNVAVPFLSRMADRNVSENEARMMVIRCVDEGY